MADLRYLLSSRAHCGSRAVCTNCWVAGADDASPIDNIEHCTLFTPPEFRHDSAISLRSEALESRVDEIRAAMPIPLFCVRIACLDLI